MNTREKTQQRLEKQIADMLSDGTSPEDIVDIFGDNPIISSLFDVYSLLDNVCIYYDLPDEVADNLAEFLKKYEEEEEEEEEEEKLERKKEVTAQEVWNKLHRIKD